MKNDFLDKVREQHEIYWRWYNSLTIEQRREHYAHKKANQPKIRHYSEEVKQLRGVQLEIKGLKR